MFKFLFILSLYGNTIIKVLFLLVRIRNILSVQEVLWVLPSYFLKWNWYFSACKRKFLESRCQFSFKFCISLQCHKHNFSIVSLTQTLYTLFKSNLLKCKFLRFSSARVKICQMPHVNFELTSKFLFKFGIIHHRHDTKLPCKF